MSAFHPLQTQPITQGARSPTCTDHDIVIKARVAKLLEHFDLVGLPV